MSTFTQDLKAIFTFLAKPFSASWFPLFPLVPTCAYCAAMRFSMLSAILTGLAFGFIDGEIWLSMGLGFLVGLLMTLALFAHYHATQTP